MAENRRTRMTKKMIHDAFLDLLEDQPITKITVTEICEKADVNRSTFYANYVDTEQLLCEIEDEVLDQIPVSSELSPGNYDESFLDMLETFFEYVKNNERVFRVLIIQADSSNFNEKMVKSVMEKYHQKTMATDSELSRYCYVYCVNGVIGLIKEWINGGFTVETRMFARIVLQMSLRVTEIQNIKL